ncbi:hypothetical protein BAUCODRAFT_400235 [Baudoinia panamericana UAMH 10762]|uniref:Zn(2)-C6 fungal-type domain-containing protein n=1 Tax=Baudoinia panamericana (strain UAMH 10762) TaxID=717646 RepID=M2LXD4_BAUPA|nr:uncharacterized protein BAUCODRAFT_400235 [Baudoinia panamericana UAMH 10762]EMC99357.1 hypothetical protein BAUCODRAFT_400235 [Baudoinia panamericana UAMH 10762]
MVYTGKPSLGCEECRRAKKKCDQALPSCGRCVRLDKICGGYRDLNELMFRDQSSSVARRASQQSEAGPSTRHPSPKKEATARDFFFNHFVTATHLSFLEKMSLDDHLLKPILACGTLALANRNSDQPAREKARRYYIEAITTINAALRHVRRVREDATLAAVLLLGIFEWLNWEPGGSSQDSWRHHVQGSSQVLQMRGRNQLRSAQGRAMFREVRSSIIHNALTSEIEVPEYVIQWTQSLDDEPIGATIDSLTLLACRMASIRTAFRTGSVTDEELAERTAELEQDLLSWSEDTLSGKPNLSAQSQQQVTTWPRTIDPTEYHINRYIAQPARSVPSITSPT